MPVLIVSLLLLTSQAHGFAELVRHGYSDCRVCHVAPSGGTGLTTYGRELSREILSTWGNENEGQALHGLVQTPEWLGLEGHFRAIQTYLNNPNIEKAAFFPMQLEAAANVLIGSFVVYSSFGVEGGSQSRKTRGEIYSPQHFAMWTFENEMAIRAGRLLPKFGIMSANHFLYSRQNLAFSLNREPYAAEYFWPTELTRIYITVFEREYSRVPTNGTTATIEVSPFPTTTIGYSYLDSSSFAKRKTIHSPYAIISWHPSWWVNIETQFIDETKKSAIELWHAQLGYEVIKGAQVYLRGQWETLRRAEGLGIEWFPRPHFQLSIEYMKEKVKAGSVEANSDFGWMVFHYYL